MLCGCFPGIGGLRSFARPSSFIVCFCFRSRIPQALHKVRGPLQVSKQNPSLDFVQLTASPLRGISCSTTNALGRSQVLPGSLPLGRSELYGLDHLAVPARHAFTRPL